MKCCLNVILIYIFSVTRSVEYLFQCLLTIHVSSLEKMSIQILCLFKKNQDICPKGNEISISKIYPIPMFTVALLTIIKIWKQSSVDGYIDKESMSVYIYYSYIQIYKYEIIHTYSLYMYTNTNIIHTYIVGHY